MATDPALRVLNRIDITEPGCWLWPGSCTPNGYGTVNARPPYVDRQKPLLVHRVMYQHFIGEIPPGLELDHLCRVRSCCNPAHLEAVTRLENVHRGSGMRGDSCPKGHAYPENIRVKGDGNIYCIVCDYARCKAYRARKRVERYVDRAGSGT
jgi:hypothetical protein